MKENTKKLMDGIIAAVREHVAAAIKANNEQFQERISKKAEAESTERRLSRHADHLARLESRLKNLESK